MIHSLTAHGGRQVYITWEIDWVPGDAPGADRHQRRSRSSGSTSPAPRRSTRCSTPSAASTATATASTSFPDEVPTDPAAPGYEERKKISPGHSWTVPREAATSSSAVGHLHPGGLHVDLQVARDGPDAGEVDGDDPAEVRPLFRSDARYYEPAGAVSWDVSMEATRRDWRISLKDGDTVSINATYDVKRKRRGTSRWGSCRSRSARPPTRWPRTRSTTTPRCEAMYDAGRDPHPRPPAREHRQAGAQEPQAPRPARAAAARATGPARGSRSTASTTRPAATRRVAGFPADLMRPPTIQPGPDRHLHQPRRAARTCPTSSRPGTASPRARRPATAARGSATRSRAGRSSSTPASSASAPGSSTEVTTGSNVYTTPPLTKPGKTYTYFCRIHPFMRGSIRVKDKR